ncbi:MAG: hypothetical protein Fur005_00290 [Roseiflexaceae bacterium]
MAPKQLRALLVALSMLLSLGFYGGSVGTAQAQSGEAPMVYPNEGTPGTRFGFNVSGFKSRERVSVWINTPDGKAIDTGIENLDRATRQGRVSWNWTAPKDATEGTYQMVALGLSSGYQQVISFRVASAVIQAAGGNIEPQLVAPGGLVTFYATGFLLDEDVRIWANDPNGQQITVELSYKKLYNGRLDASWILPTAAQPGQWSLVIRGVDSGIQQVLPFRVRS